MEIQLDWPQRIYLPFPFYYDYTVVWYECLLAVQSEIQGLNFGGSSPPQSSSIIVQKLPWAKRFLLPSTDPDYLPSPGIIICQWNRETMDPSEGTNIKDDVGYPVLVSIVAKDQQNLTAHQEDYLGWRQQIARHFRNQRLNGVDEVYVCEVQPNIVTLPEAFLQNIYHSALVLNFTSREVRGDS